MRWAARGVLVLAVAAFALLGASAAGPRTDVPVLLVPGWFDTGREMAALRIRLLGAGWDEGAVEALTFEDPTGSNRAHALEVAAAVERLREATGAERVDIVAHSMGGLATRWYLMTHGSEAVRRAVFIASPHQGTYSAYVAWGEGALEMKPESDFLVELNEAPSVPGGVEAITVWTPLDTHIVPASSARLAGYPDYRVCCPTHAGLLRDADVFRIVRAFLDHGYEAGR